MIEVLLLALCFHFLGFLPTLLLLGIILVIELANP
jgi:hypothetical protein